MATTEKPELRDYAAVLLDLPGAHLDATEQLNKLIGAVRDTGKTGTLTVKIKVSVGKLDNTTLELLPDVSVSIPKMPLRGGVFYADDTNNPTKDDPAQLWRGDDIRSAPTFADINLSTGEVIKEAPAND